MDCDFLIVGAGLSGAVLAERIANVLKKRVIVIDKRASIGGNCYDYVDEETGILMNAYGAHLFHTNMKDVWEYVNQFCEWRRWDHKVVAQVDEKLVPLPININTINSLFDLNLSCEQEMKEWLEANVEKLDDIQNSQDLALTKVGRKIYEKIFKDYTQKQWNKSAKELDPSVLARIPLRYDFDDRYFTDKYQALPVKGYTKFFEKLLESELITVHLNTNFFQDVRVPPGVKVVYTGPIDRYFADKGLPFLEYRSLHFDIERLNVPYYQPNSVVNYPQADAPFTRIVEYKHFLNQKSDKTVIVREFPSDIGEPYYPVPSEQNKKLYERYQELADQEKDVYFVGRLATYKYLNMDQAIKAALDTFEDIRKSF